MTPAPTPCASASPVRRRRPAPRRRSSPSRCRCVGPRSAQAVPTLPPVGARARSRGCGRDVGAVLRDSVPIRPPSGATLRAAHGGGSAVPGSDEPLAAPLRPYTLLRVFGPRSAPCPVAVATRSPSAVMACLDRAAHAPVRDGRHHADPGAGRQHPPQLRLALRGGRDPAQARPHRGAGGGAGGTAARTHRLPHHRGGPGRGRRLAGRAARHLGQGVPPLRGRASR